MGEDNRTLGDPGSEGFRVDRYPFYLLNRAVGRYNIIIGGELRRIGLTIPIWRVLMVLGERSPRSIGELADAVIINLSTTQRIIQRMEAAGLVITAPRLEDARVTNVEINAAGRDKLACARKVTAPVYAALIDGFSAEDFNDLLTLLGRLQSNLDEASQA